MLLDGQALEGADRGFGSVLRLAWVASETRKQRNFLHNAREWRRDVTPKDDLWRPEDYDDEPRTNGNFGLDPFQQKCKEAAEKRELQSRAEAEKKERAG
jgi:hypothetical protein